MRITAAGLALMAGVGLSSFSHWEPGGETWGYWYFARVFVESEKFIIPERSPLYTLYLNGFRWLDYPASVTVEYLVTSCIVAIALAVLFRPYLGLGVAVFAALLWVPFLQRSDPPVQGLALACSCLAIAARSAGNDRFRLALSYALLGLAYMFRHTYILVVLLFLARDTVRVVRSSGRESFFLDCAPELVTGRFCSLRAC